jgi:hypothetical protein
MKTFMKASAFTALMLMPMAAHAEDPVDTFMCGVTSPVRSMAESAAAQDNPLLVVPMAAVGAVGGVIMTVANSVDAVFGGPALTCERTTYIAG